MAGSPSSTSKTDGKGGWSPRELGQSLLLKEIDLDPIRGLLEDCPVRDLKNGEVLIRAGQANESLYLLLSGRLKIQLRLSLDPIATLEAGEIAGEISVLDGQPATACVVADERCRLLVFDRKALWSLLNSCPQVALNLLFILAQRFRHDSQLALTGQQLQREYAQYAIIDAATGIYNHRWFVNTLPRQLEVSKKREQPFSVLLIGIDGFEKYLGTYGQLVTDRLLYTVARTVRDAMRPGEFIARHREEELAALLPKTDAATARKVGERLCKSVSGTRFYQADRKPLPSVTISVGVAEMRSRDTGETLLAAAGRALVNARKKGNRVAKVRRSP